MGILYVLWMKSRKLDINIVLDIHSMDAYMSLSVLDVYVSSILYDLISNYWT